MKVGVLNVLGVRQHVLVKMWARELIAVKPRIFLSSVPASVILAVKIQDFWPKESITGPNPDSEKN